MSGNVVFTSRAGGTQPSSPSFFSCGCASNSGPRPDASATPMMPLPLPNVQKSSNPLWPTPVMAHSRLGEGTVSNAFRVTVSSGTTASTVPPRKNDGLSGSDAGSVVVVLLASPLPSCTPDAIDT